MLCQDREVGDCTTTSWVRFYCLHFEELHVTVTQSTAYESGSKAIINQFQGSWPRLIPKVICYWQNWSGNIRIISCQTNPVTFWYETRSFGKTDFILKFLFQKQKYCIESYQTISVKSKKFWYKTRSLRETDFYLKFMLPKQKFCIESYHTNSAKSTELLV